MADNLNLQPLAEKQWIVTVEGLPGTWRQMTAPSTTRESINYTDPTLGKVRQHLTFSSNDDITLTMDCDAKTHGEVVKWCQERMKGKNTVTPFSVTYNPVYADTEGTPYDGSAKYSITGCMLKNYKAPGVNRAGNGLSTVEIIVVWDDIVVS